ncbi:MAG: DUF4249 domain-containing protein [Cyclobacteriaceae bacterium]
MRTHALLSFCLLAGSVACTREIDLLLPVSSPQLVLNGLLHPDSTIQISLTTTIPVAADSTDFPLVDNATVRLYEDDDLVGGLVFQDSLYTLDYYPKAGSKYTVQADVPGFETVSATDRMPYLLDAQACTLQESPNGSPYFWFKTTVHDHPLESNFYWLYIVITNYGDRVCEYFPDRNPSFVCIGDSSTLFTQKAEFLHSYSILPDKFNAAVDNTDGGGTIYDGYIRVDDNVLNGETFSLEMTLDGYPMFRYEDLNPLDSNQTVQLKIANTSRHYDRYLKSSWIYFLNNDYFYEPNPFSETTQIYSNVENGTGIFAAYNSLSIDLQDYPCE